MFPSHDRCVNGEKQAVEALKIPDNIQDIASEFLNKRWDLVPHKIDKDAEDYPEPWNAKWFKAYVDEHGDDDTDYNEFLEAIDEEGITGVFSDSGFENDWVPCVEDIVSERTYNVWDSMVDRDQNGLISIWRMITLTSNNKLKSPKGRTEDPYKDIINHNGIGVYWSWEKDAAEAHWGGSQGS